MKSTDQAASYGIRVILDLPFAEAVAKTTEALKNEGFGVLSEIDIREKLKEKLNVDMPNYLILGACNPPLAHKALQAEPEIGLLLPCNVIVYEKGGKTVVSAVDPDAMLGIVNNPAVAAVAEDAKKKLQAAIAALSA
jgi:uncharacterized protein (DUF302 family)